MNLTVLIFAIVGALLAIGLFFGFIGGVGKSFHPTPTPALRASDIKEKGRQSSEDARLKQKQTMEDLKQRIEDNRR
jgi:ABC-type antimicrobial peptide transport system permease subunit